MKKIEKIEKINKEKIVLALIIVIQIVVYIFLGTQKTYLHMDEAFSIGLAHYDKMDITKNEDFYNNWHNKEYYEDYISIEKDEVSDWKPVYENQKKDVHPPFYYLLLRIAYLFKLESFSKWPGIILNIIILVISNILVYKILKQTIKDKRIILLISLVNGLTIATFESVLYIRMYALSALFLLLIAYIHLKNFEKENIKISTCALIGLTVLLAALTHYYNVVYIGVIYLIYIIRYIKHKKYKNIFKYTITMIIAAGIFLLIFPHAIDHILVGDRGVEVLSAFKNPADMLTNLGGFIYITNNNIFNGLLWIILIILEHLAIILLYNFVKDKKGTVKIENIKLLLITIPAFVYFLLVGLSSPFIEIRYIIPVCSFIFIYIIYLLNLLFNKLFNQKIAKILFVIVMILIVIMPMLLNIKINNLYLEHKEIIEKVEEKYYSELPTIYLFNTNQNRFLDDIYLFTKIEESYILDIEKANEEKINEILENKDTTNGILLWVNEGFEKDNYIKMIMDNKKLKNCEHLKRMNACDMYYIH